jgi:uncharacterized membrane protein YedE/YeeE
MIQDVLLAVIQGSVVGFIFGFLLQKGGVARAQVIIEQLLLRNFTVLKIILTAIVVGGFLLYGARDFGLLQVVPIKQLPSYMHLYGGLIFGVGMALLGYCPGTCLAAAGQGARDAWWGIGGMMVGALVYTMYRVCFVSPLLAQVHKPTMHTFVYEYVGCSSYALLFILLCVVVVFYVLSKVDSKRL